MSEDGHYDNTPGAREDEKKGRGALAWSDFQTEMQSRRQELKDTLPADVPVNRFIAVSVAAVKNKPDLLFADKRSLFGALSKAAQDGLLPDGREAVINVYNTKQKDGSYLKIAQYSPMTHGIRKRARELDNIIIDAQVVHKEDKFKRVQGDDPKIIHEPADELPNRGPLVLVYAIFKQDGVILHREVMNATQVEAVRNQSKDPDSLMWKKFPEEGWRKSVIRRGAKTVPTSESLDRLITRDDENFDFAPAEPKAALVPPPAPKLESKPAQTLDVAVKKEDVPVEVPVESVELSEAAYAGILQDARDELEGSETEEQIAAVKEKWLDEMRVGDRKAFLERASERSAEIFGSI